MLQYKIPIGIALFSLMAIFHIYDHWESSPEPPEDVSLTVDIPPVTKPEKVQSATRDVEVATVTPEPTKPTAPPPPPPKKEIPAWLPISEAQATGRASLPLDGAEYIAIEGIENHPERIYQNPDCEIRPSKQVIDLHDVLVNIEGQYLPTETILREKAEAEALIEKVIPILNSSTEVLPLDSVIIE